MHKIDNFKGLFFAQKTDDFCHSQKQGTGPPPYLSPPTASTAVVPGEAFGEEGQGFVRLSYAGDADELRKGLRRMCDFCGEESLTPSGACPSFVAFTHFFIVYVYDLYNRKHTQ